MPSYLTLRKESVLSSFRFAKENILQIIHNLDPSIAHGYDEISIRMLKMCGDSICRPLNIIFKTCLRIGKFFSEWKKANIFPIHKKGYKQTVKTTVLFHFYRSVVKYLNDCFIMKCLTFF